MANRRAGVLLFVVMAGVGASPAAQLQPGYLDPRPVLDAARKAIGADNLRCVTVAGTGYAGMVGQQRLNDKNVDWPRGEPLANYTRTMNWEASTHEGGVRPQAGPQSRVLEIRAGVAGRNADSAESAPDIHGQRQPCVAHGRHRKHSGSVAAARRGALRSWSCG